VNCFWLLADCPPASVLAQYYFRKVGSAAGPKSTDETRIGAIFTGGRLSFPPPAQLDCPQNDQITLPLQPLLFSCPIPSPLRRCCSFFVDSCVFYDVFQPFQAATYFNLYIFRRLIFRRHTVAKHPPHTHIPPRSRALSGAPPSPRASFLGLLLLCFYWRPPNAWAPTPSLFHDMSRFGTQSSPPSVN